LTIQIPDKEGGSYSLLPAATNHYVDSRPAIFAIDSEEPMEFLTANQTAKLLRDPTMEAYLYVVRNTSSEPDTTEPINFASNDTLIHGSPPSVPPTDSTQIRKHTADMERLLQQFQDYFREELTGLPPSRNFEHTIDTGDADPININAYPLSPVHLQE
jgi:hypothetical protein